MLADLPRLGFRLLPEHRNSFQKDSFTTGHRVRRYGLARIFAQFFFQNILYILSLAIVYALYRDIAVLILVTTYMLLIALQIHFQIRRRSAFVTSPEGHRMNDYVIKPYRLLILIFMATNLREIVWLLGFGLHLIKWLLTTCYEKLFDVPNWYHAILIVASMFAVLLIYPYDLGSIEAPWLLSLLTTIPKVYVTYVGLLGTFFGIILGEHRNDDGVRRYFIGGFILNFVFVSFLSLLCLTGLLTIKSPALDLTATSIFSSNISYTFIRLKEYVLFGIVFPLSWLLFFFINMTGVLMLLKIGKLTPDYFKRLDPGHEDNTDTLRPLQPKAPP